MPTRSRTRRWRASWRRGKRWASTWCHCCSRSPIPLARSRLTLSSPSTAGHRFFNGGTTVVLETEDDHTLVLTTRLIGNTSLQQMYSVGVRPETKHVVVAKGVVSPRPAYAPIAPQVVLVNTPGVTTSDLSTFTYHNRRRPLYPFEADATY
ncbi:MAG: hypothetical protein E6G39_07835 [Actinobacteria bacterium]|nr:MAG: hypothetical protein E6G39_07835 [Actinomycetota bacterium]